MIVNLIRIRALYAHARQAIDTPRVMAGRQWWIDLYRKAWAVREVREMVSALQGYKTYIMAALSAALTLLKALGKIDDATYQTLMALLGSGAVATVAAKINRIQKF